MGSSTTAQKFRARVRALMAKQGWNETETARRLRQIRKKWDQPRFHRCMKGEQHWSFDGGDFDDIAKLFGLTVPELFLDEYKQWDRRTGNERRSGVDRRQRSDRFYGPVEREHWPQILRDMDEKKKKHA